jgi:hypothetical protein
MRRFTEVHAIKIERLRQLSKCEAAAANGVANILVNFESNYLEYAARARTFINDSGPTRSLSLFDDRRQEGDLQDKAATSHAVQSLRERLKVLRPVPMDLDDQEIMGEAQSRQATQDAQYLGDELLLHEEDPEAYRNPWYERRIRRYGNFTGGASPASSSSKEAAFRGIEEDEEFHKIAKGNAATETQLRKLIRLLYTPVVPALPEDTHNMDEQPSGGESVQSEQSNSGMREREVDSNPEDFQGSPASRQSLVGGLSGDAHSFKRSFHTRAGAAHPLLRRYGSSAVRADNTIDPELDAHKPSSAPGHDASQSPSQSSTNAQRASQQESTSIPSRRVYLRASRSPSKAITSMCGSRETDLFSLVMPLGSAGAPPEAEADAEADLPLTQRRRPHQAAARSSSAIKQGNSEGSSESGVATVAREYAAERILVWTPPWAKAQGPGQAVAKSEQRLLQAGIVGVPNSGKSALTNALVGTKVMSSNC